MKLLFFSDLHNDAEAARDIVQDSSNVDVVLGAGDYCNIHRGLESTIAILARVDRPCILVAGNAETTDELRNACRNHQNLHVLHGDSITIENVTFFGIGGGIPVTPFGSWSYDFTEQQAEELLEACPDRGVFVSHSPPKGAVDVSSAGKSLGSTAIRETILRTKPSVAICGHIHDSAGRDAVLGETVIVNAGPRYPKICVLEQFSDSWKVKWQARS